MPYKEQEEFELSEWKYNDDCKSLDTIKCEHDGSGAATEFDKFEIK